MCVGFSNHIFSASSKSPAQRETKKALVQDKMACYTLPSYPQYFARYPFISLGGESHSEIKVSFQEPQSELELGPLDPESNASGLVNPRVSLRENRVTFWL